MTQSIYSVHLHDYICCLTEVKSADLSSKDSPSLILSSMGISTHATQVDIVGWVSGVHDTRFVWKKVVTHINVVGCFLEEETEIT